ncbi:hypothetical protein Zmor_021838 [Zophobas morio]|uniref:Uncharacterized protein n=1 Tax=Zophobas morio TaxID=2755281 RepID=A0AA38I6B8_9CUCU|nr:hypothetical protein Zmor_021838 [Zophobas morio]
MCIFIAAIENVIGVLMYVRCLSLCYTNVVRIQFEFLNFKRIPRAQETVSEKKERLATNHPKETEMRKARVILS